MIAQMTEQLTLLGGMLASFILGGAIVCVAGWFAARLTWRIAGKEGSVFKEPGAAHVEQVDTD